MDARSLEAFLDAGDTGIGSGGAPESKKSADLWTQLGSALAAVADRDRE